MKCLLLWQLILVRLQLLKRLKRQLLNPFTVVILSYINLFLFSGCQSKREAEEEVYKKYLTTSKTRYTELMLIVDNVVVSYSITWENRSTRRKISRSKDENQQQTQLAYDTGSRTRATRKEDKGKERKRLTPIIGL